MFDVEAIRKDFPMLNKLAKNGRKIVYFDNGATSFKPNCVIDAVNNYYKNMTSNVHRGDYDLSFEVDNSYEDTRKKVANFINAEVEEVVFFGSNTLAINQVAYGIEQTFIKENDEIIISTAEHASNILPWYRIADNKQAVIKFVPLDDEGRITIENIKQMITNKTRVIALAHVGNVLGYKLDVKALTKLAHSLGIYVVIDGAQSVPHFKTDVKELDIDFLTFSGHKMLGPSGVGIMYGKLDLLEKIPPFVLGGGMNTRFDNKGHLFVKKSPHKFEAGTPPIEAVIGLGAAVDYLTKLGMENIEKYEKQLRDYAVKKLSQNPDVIIYNKNGDVGIVTFNYKNIFCQDFTTFLNAEGLALRSGQHCAKILIDFIKQPGTVRASFNFYNTFEEIDYFVEVCKRGSEYLDVYFK